MGAGVSACTLQAANVAEEVGKPRRALGVAVSVASGNRTNEDSFKSRENGSTKEESTMWSEDRERQPYIIPRSENPRELLSFQMKLSASRRARVGLDGNCCVLAIDENGEAAKAGLRVGDRLVSVTVMSQDGDVENPVSTRAKVNQIFANAVGTLEIHALRSLRNRALDGYADDVFLYSPTRIRPSGATLVDLAAVAAVDSAKHGLTSSRVAARDGSSENSTRYGRRRRNHRSRSRQR